jgi:hypothetical protein
MARCKGGICAGDEKAIDAAAIAFQTPADKRVHDALREAFEQGGIGKEDFARAVRTNVFMWTGMPFGEPQAACIIAREAANRR